jgi:hypothetical protein
MGKQTKSQREWYLRNRESQRKFYYDRYWATKDPNSRTLLRGFTRENVMSHCSVDPLTQCWNWSLRTKVGNGYGLKHVDGRWELAHRLSYKLFIGAIPAGNQVMHKCDNPACINPDHLAVGTNRDNQIDAMRKGRWKKPPTLTGTDHPGWKLGRYAA